MSVRKRYEFFLNLLMSQKLKKQSYVSKRNIKTCVRRQNQGLNLDKKVSNDGSLYKMRKQFLLKFTKNKVVNFL